MRGAKGAPGSPLGQRGKQETACCGRASRFNLCTCTGVRKAGRVVEMLRATSNCSNSPRETSHACHLPRPRFIVRCVFICLTPLDRTDPPAPCVWASWSVIARSSSLQASVRSALTHHSCACSNMYSFRRLSFPRSSRTAIDDRRTIHNP